MSAESHPGRTQPFARHGRTAGGIPAGISTTNSPEQCQYITDHCEATLVVAEEAL